MPEKLTNWAIGPSCQSRGIGAVERAQQIEVLWLPRAEAPVHSGCMRRAGHPGVRGIGRHPIGASRQRDPGLSPRPIFAACRACNAASIKPLTITGFHATGDRILGQTASHPCFDHGQPRDHLRAASALSLRRYSRRPKRGPDTAESARRANGQFDSDARHDDSPRPSALGFTVDGELHLLSRALSEYGETALSPRRRQP